ncbi:MAG: acyl-ACP--UDP-N-acetylglucosamine O-acyltransferase [Phycisphaeraceae bacterium]|nr:acyl-ACP--UDP-N-acetylglucosamine O-acyltransferase [Phycisphaeraceae bacterium]
MPNLHPTAIVDRNARLADDVQVGPYSIIGPKVTIASGTVIGSHCVIENRTTIGRHNRIFHHVQLGQEPQDLKYRGEDAELIIGNHNDLRENVTVHIGTENGGGSTSIGSHNLVMVNTHIAHDCHVGDHCILSNNVMLAGHILIDDHAVLAGAAAITHYVTIGRYAFVGGVAGVVHDCPPFMVSDGHPARPRGVNLIGLKRNKFQDTTIDLLKRAYQGLWGSKREGSMGAALEKIEAEHGHDKVVMELIEFVRNATSSPNGRYEESKRRDDKQSTPTK